MLRARLRVTPERLDAIEQLFHEARRRPDAEREAFLARVCAGDSALRREVESLLMQPADGMIDAPLAALIGGIVSQPSVLPAGRRIGVFEVQGLLGVGGMGEVYRARDTRLGREVAIKLLPRAFKDDPDRVARFEREARLLASLNHPHIGAIYGLESADEVSALVMELVDGEDLSQRLCRGALALDEALPIVKQMAGALQAAHEHGIIHRDLKPANIKVRPDGTVKVLDFGLAKATEAVGTTSTMNSPTLSMHATQAGVILGTAAYMSPEQARGRSVDKRTDLWAFGCVLFEMLSGVRPFRGDDVTDTIAAILRADPDWTRLPAETPPSIRRLLRRCLEKDRARRLADASDAALEIDDANTSATVEHAGGPGLIGTRAHQLVWRLLPWTVAGALAVGLALAVLGPWNAVGSPPPLRLSADLGADILLTSTATRSGLSLSADGSSLAFVAQKGASGRAQLYLRRLDQLQATALPGTEDADAPFFSPDDQWIAFFAGGKLKKTPAAGGTVISLCDAPSGGVVGGGAWSEDGTIVFAASSFVGAGGLMRVSSAGGAAEALSPSSDDHLGPRWPQLLPGGSAILFTGTGATGSYDHGNLGVQLSTNGSRRIVLRDAYFGRYVPSGHVIFIRDGTLFAAPFDGRRLEVTGAAVPIVESVTAGGVSGGAQVSVSASGVLAYVPGSSVTGLPVSWLDREGRTMLLRATPSEWFNARFAPDGHRIALQIFDGKSIDIWTYDWTRDALTRVTAAGGNKTDPVWTPDNRRLVFASDIADTSTTNLTLRKRNLYWQPADGSGDAERLTQSPHHQLPGSWHPNGKFLVFEEEISPTNRDILILPVEGNAATGWKPGTPIPFAGGPDVEHEPKFSPDGRWIAYTSNESGREEVYVRPFPGPGGKWPISSGGGHFPIWSPTRPELFYGHEGQIMVTGFVVDGEVFRADKPRLWSEGRYVSRGPFDLHPDGERFAIAAPAPLRDGARPDHLTFVFNFFEELRRLTLRR
jgi:Tol biopolymer transport system component